MRLMWTFLDDRKFKRNRYITNLHEKQVIWIWYTSNRKWCNFLVKEILEKTDQLWSNCKSKNAQSCIKKIQELTENPNYKKWKLSTTFFYQSGVLKIRGHFLLGANGICRPSHQPDKCDTRPLLRWVQGGAEARCMSRDETHPTRSVPLTVGLTNACVISVNIIMSEHFQRHLRTVYL